MKIPYHNGHMMFDETRFSNMDTVEPHAGHGFWDLPQAADGEAPVAVLAAIEGRKPHETTADQWQAQILARILVKYRIILVTTVLDSAMVEKMHMIHASDIGEALLRVLDMTRENARILVIPNGVDVIMKTLQRT
jgi:hypothetical protein